jgi:hypothetical protein
MDRQVLASQSMTTLHHNDSLNSISISPLWSVASNLSLTNQSSCLPSGAVNQMLQTNKHTEPFFLY